jgi:G:T/U-mismatch repair DNA glycosylase
MDTLASHGFALWDVVKSCQRKGSLDADIQLEECNDIRGFCQEHSTIKRIVLANGGTASSFFNKHFKEWWESGQLQPAQDEFSQRAFGKVHARVLKQKVKKNAETTDKDAGVITCIAAISVSPAAARYSYKEKRDFWEQHVYRPGLQDYQESLLLKQE